MSSYEVVQLFEKETSTYTYLIYDLQSKEGLIIDPVDICFDRDSQLIEQLKVTLKYTLETHIHADHLSAGYLHRKKFRAKIGLSEKVGSPCADLMLADGDRLFLGKTELFCLWTPGHTQTCLSYYLPGSVFTGDALLINGCGRTDFQGGSHSTLFHSVRNVLFTLPGETRVYPGHDYNGFTCSTIEQEQRNNPRLKISRSYEEYKEIMDNLILAHPQKIEQAVPANLNCGQLK